MTSLDIGRRISRKLLHSFFTTQQYPYTKHHIDSFDQFLSRDLLSILQAQNPILILKDLLVAETGTYRYKVEIFVGGIDGTAVEIGNPVVSLENGDDVRVLFPNEARLRNLTYAAQIRADILVRITYIEKLETGELTEPQEREISFQKVPLFKIPIMLHSSYCHLNGKPKQFLQEAGECPYDAGGYFIIDGSEKVLVTRQEPAFNTLYISKKQADPKISIYASVSSLSPETRIVKRVAFAIKRSNGAMYATIPFVRKPVNVFLLFRAMGIQSDEAIMRLIFPDPNSAEAKFLEDKLIPTITDAYPFLTTTMAIQYMKSVTKGFTEFTIMDVLKNQLFIHVSDTPGARANYLAECVRNILRVEHGFDNETSRDDIRNQRCLVSGFSIQMLFNGIYSQWKKEVSYAVDLEYNWNTRIYSGLNFANIFADGNRAKIFKEGVMTEKLMRAFKGKWGTGMGEDKDGLLQMLSRLSYLDFMSHCRRVVLAFDTSMKLTGPRHLHPSQFGYFCTSETPGGASIGITKNLSILTTISTGMRPEGFVEWLRTRGGVVPCASVTPEQKSVFVPVALNNGIIGYTADHKSLLTVLKAMKHTGFLPPFVSLGFNYIQRRIFIFTDEGRPLRPLIIIPENKEIPTDKIAASKSWRDLIIGTHPGRANIDLSTSEFKDPFEDQEERRPSADDYLRHLLPHVGCLEYVDPYEHNEAFIACYNEHIVDGTTHMEIHPSTMMSLMTSMIPFANHNQSPRNQLSCSQSKQGISIYATNWRNRFDNSVHILCSGEAPLTRTLYYDYSAEGKIPYGNNCILALAMYQGYNQEDGIVFNKTSLDRGLFRTVAFRSYEFFEENDDKTGVKTRIGNPAKIGGWTDLRPGLDYMKMDDRGIIKVGEYVDENTVIIGGYIQAEKGKYKDASMTPKVWTSGIVESVNITVNNNGLRLVKVRVVQDRQPELGDKFSNRHGQKGTMGMMIRAEDMPRSPSGIVPDIIVNPHSIPSRMTMAQLLEQQLGKLAAIHGGIGDATAFMNEGNPAEMIGDILEKQYGYERYGNEILYDGITGKQMDVAIFMGPIYTMRLKHMVEDKWQARTTGRKEVKTHQPTGGRGNEGGLRIGEMDRDSIIAHGIAGFVQESYMKRSDGTKMPICTGCGTIPIFNEKLGIAVCPLCQGPLRFAGNTAESLEMIPPIRKQMAPIVQVEIPYVLKVLDQELSTFMNTGLRFMTTSGVQKLDTSKIAVDNTASAVILPERRLFDMEVPMFNEEGAEEQQPKREVVPNLSNLAALAKQAGLALVPEGSVMTRDIPKQTQQVQFNSNSSSNTVEEKIVEGSEESNEESTDDQLVQIVPGAIPTRVLGSRATIAPPQIIPATPALTQQQLASVLVNTAVQQPALLATAAAAAQQQMMPTGPAIVVDTTPRAMTAEGLDYSAPSRPAGETLRVRRERPRVSFRGGDEAPAPAPSFSGGGALTVNKIG
jgi:DNA-directed RNA polymerase II subunit RPB2